MKVFLLDVLKGIAIGSGAILPGISSGVFCVIFGIYEKLLDSILNFFKNIRQNIKFLCPIAIGATLGILLFSKGLNYSLYHFPIQTKSIFIGLILGSLPSLIREANKKTTFKLSYLVFFSLALLIGIGCIFLENYLIPPSLQNINFLYFVICGFCMSIGVIVPGVSSTIILMLLGIYDIYLASISNLYFPVLLPLSIGLIIGGFCFMKLTKYLLDNYYVPTFYSIIGFTIGSIFVLLPSLYSVTEVLLSFLCCVLRILYYYFAKIVMH